MASLYGEVLIDNPARVLHAASEFLGLGLSAEQIDAIASSDDLFTDAKNTGKPFSQEERAHRYQQLEEFFGADLDDGLEWLLRNNPGSKLTPEPGGALPVLDDALA